MIENPQARLVITDDDLADETISRRVESLRAAAVPQTVRAVGAPPPGAGGSRKWWLGGTGASTIAGVLGGLAGWVLSEVISRPDSVDQAFADDPAMGTAFFLVLFAIGLAGVMASWEGIQLRSANKALRSLAVAIPVVAVAGFLIGYLAQTAVYQPMVEAAYERALGATTEAQFESTLINGIRVARTIAFLILGAVLGLAYGASTRSGKRAINGLIGGAIGGLVGGFLFDFIAEAVQSGVPSRAVALTLTGSVTGLAIGLVEQARKDHWLEIVTGGMAGKQFIIYHDKTDVGSAAACHVTLIKDPSIPEVALTLVTSGAQMVLEPRGGAPVKINGQPAGRTPLGDGDLIEVGGTMLRYGQKAQAVPQVVMS